MHNFVKQCFLKDCPNCSPVSVDIESGTSSVRVYASVFAYVSACVRHVFMHMGVSLR